MCLITIALSVAVVVTDAVPMAEYRKDVIRVNPAVCELPESTQAFILAHEEAHHTEQHLNFVGGTPTKQLELEADRIAVDKVKSLGYDSCTAVDPVLHLRGFWSATHPNRFTLKAMACEG